MAAPITSLYAAAIILIAVVLIANVIKARTAGKVWLGEGSDEGVIRAMRSQANLVETAPFALLAMLLLELNGMSGWLLHLYGIVLVLARIAHPIGMSNKYPKMPFRMVGASATTMLLVVAGLALVGQQLVG